MRIKFPHTDPHIHQYKKVRLNKSVVFKCILPGCTHYLRNKLAENAITICNRCGINFILTKRAMRLTWPHCDECTIRKEKDKIDAIKELLEVR